jgi:hypothetical protein
MINCRRRTHLHRFIAYQDENGWLDVRANVHAIIGSDNTAVVNGARAVGTRRFLVVRIRWTRLCSAVFPARINDGIRNDIAAEREQGDKRRQQMELRHPKQTHFCDVLLSPPGSVNQTDYPSKGSNTGLRDNLEAEIAIRSMCIH